MPRKLGRTADLVSASTAHSEKTRDRLYFTPTRSPTANLPTANRHRQIPHPHKKNSHQTTTSHKTRHQRHIPATGVQNPNISRFPNPLSRSSFPHHETTPNRTARRRARENPPTVIR